MSYLLISKKPVNTLLFAIYFSFLDIKQTVSTCLVWCLLHCRICFPILCDIRYQLADRVFCLNFLIEFINKSNRIFSPKTDTERLFADDIKLPCLVWDRIAVEFQEFLCVRFIQAKRKRQIDEYLLVKFLFAVIRGDVFGINRCSNIILLKGLIITDFFLFANNLDGIILLLFTQF